MSRKGKIALGIVLVVIVLLLLVVIAGGLYAWHFWNGSKNITVKAVGASRVPDGKYRGEYAYFHVTATVDVTVKGGKIEEVTIVEGSTNRKQMETVVQRVIDGQTLEVDTVSGATVSGKGVLKAIEDALTGSSQ
jgi:uncharacterized protein with FMN-binding domain